MISKANIQALLIKGNGTLSIKGRGLPEQVNVGVITTDDSPGSIINVSNGGNLQLSAGRLSNIEINATSDSVISFGAFNGSIIASNMWGVESVTSENRWYSNRLGPQTLLIGSNAKIISESTLTIPKGQTFY